MPSIQIRDIRKSFGDIEAVRGIDLTVEKGTVLGLLGPNGAGKTTLIRMLTTLMKIDSGEAWVEGLNVDTEAQAVREIIGLAGQYAAVDENLTGRENLIMVGRLYHMPMKEAQLRAADLLGHFDLTDAADRTLKTYSGGMRRRLDLAASLVNNPPVLFLDEPTTGLDPQSRIALWKIIRELVAQGTTVLLTTQYLDEADFLADRIVVIDHGKVIASGTPQELKTELGDEVLEVRIRDISRINEATAALRSIGESQSVHVDFGTQTISMTLDQGVGSLPKAIRALDVAHVEIEDLTVRRPTLDEIFLKLTGHGVRV
ncbi:MAG: antibiotic transport system ATP-binding protein [Parcubacteria group bacterium Athens0416_74]|nr:MAG: antibiotic transport system ATP-binding protein [Parcubacteria group bacterium Athens0416_74]